MGSSHEPSRWFGKLMLYAATTFWLVVIVFTAWGIHRMWCALVPPKVVNSVLLPGTLMAAIGYVIGMLITGGTVNDTALIRDDDSGEPQTDKNPKPRIPVIGPIVVAMLPMLSCAGSVYCVNRYLGGGLIDAMSASLLPQALPATRPEFWELLRQCVTLTESMLEVVLASDLAQWPVWLFIYLTICLTVRMGPLPGTVRGAVGAILILGPLSALIGTTTNAGQQAIESGWSLLSFAVAALLFLMLVTLAVRGTVGFVRVLSAKG